LTFPRLKTALRALQVLVYGFLKPNKKETPCQCRQGVKLAN